jgi:DNA-directed RNA polymerase beta' subunit
VWFHDINSSNLPIGQRGALEVWNVVKNKNKIVYETFSKFGTISSSALLDSLKLLGFHYATNAGISINIEDVGDSGLDV